MSAHEWPEFDDISNDFMERLSERDFYNYAKVRIDACDVLQQELDAARLEVERLRGALTDIRDSNGWIGTDHKYMKLLASEALAAQQDVK